MQNSWICWIVFNLIIFILLYIDLHYFHKKSQDLSWKSALKRSLFWVGLSLLWNGYIYWSAGEEKALFFFTGYVIEKSLSIDNLFVFLMIFSTFGLSIREQYRILYFGILGALVFRLSFIFFGILLLEKFAWMYTVFGAFLCFSAVHFFRQRKMNGDISKSRMLLFFMSHLKKSNSSKSRLWMWENGKLYFTPFAAALLFIESSDVIFALDSIPAVLAITTDPWIVYTSNACAILGLRSLYFVVAHLYQKMAYIKVAISFLLFWIGLKMLLSGVITIPLSISLLVIIVTLSVAIFLSLFRRKGTLK